MKRFFPILLMGGIFGSLAMADVELKLADGSGDFVIIDGSGTILGSSGITTIFAVGSDGTVTWDGKIGNYNVNVTTGQGAPGEPAATLDLNSADTSKGPSGALTLSFSENGVTPAYTGWALSFGGTLASGTGSNVSYTAYESNTNNFFATDNTIATLGPFAGSTGGNSFSGDVSGSVAGVVAPYSLTQVILLNGVGATGYSGDASLTPVPEPISVMLFGTVVALCASRLRKRRLS